MSELQRREGEPRLDSCLTLVVTKPEEGGKQNRMGSCPVMRDDEPQHLSSKTRLDSCPVMKNSEHPPINGQSHFGSCSVMRLEATPAMNESANDGVCCANLTGISLLRETILTLRAILLQIMLLILLIMRLHALALVCLTRKLEMPGRSFVFSILNILDITLQQGQREGQGEHPAPTFILSTLTERIKQLILSYVKTAKTLYLLCKLLQEEEAVSSNVGTQSTSPRPEAVDRREPGGLRMQRYRVPYVEEEDVDLTLPSFASQLHNPSLGDDEGYLDGILADFGIKDSSEEAEQYCRTISDAKKSIDAEQNQISSIQTTPECFKAPAMQAKEGVKLHGQRLEPDFDNFSLSSPTKKPQSKSNDNLREDPPKPEKAEKGIKIAAPSEGQTTWTKVFEVCDHDKSTTGDVQRCPTCSSRQSRSRIPKRNEQGKGNRSTSVESQVSSASTNVTSPRKLQRKVMRY